MKAKDLSSGQECLLSEKRSASLTLLTGLAAIAFIGSLLTTASFAYIHPIFSLFVFLPVVVSLIYVVVFNHLRKKGDMSLDKATFETIEGNEVIVHKKKSIWITLAMVIATIFLLVFLVMFGFGIYMLAAAQSFGIFGILGAVMGVILAFIGGIALLVLLLYLAALNFLRAKLDFKGEIVEIKGAEGTKITLCKRSNVWITIAMIFSLVLTIFYFVSGSYQFYVSYRDLISNPFLGILFPAAYLSAMGGIYGSLSSGVTYMMGISQLIDVAVFNFLRVRGHVS